MASIGNNTKVSIFDLAKEDEPECALPLQQSTQT
jgi:hypothetical protein